MLSSHLEVVCVMMPASHACNLLIAAPYLGVVSSQCDDYNAQSLALSALCISSLKLQSTANSVDSCLI